MGIEHKGKLNDINKKCLKRESKNSSENHILVYLIVLQRFITHSERATLKVISTLE